MLIALLPFFDVEFWLMEFVVVNWVFTAHTVELSGAISEGDTRKEALANIKEAIEGYLEAFPEELDQLKRKRERWR